MHFNFAAKTIPDKVCYMFLFFATIHVEMGAYLCFLI